MTTNRTLGPRGPKGLRSGYFEANDRNKRSITVDVKKEQGKEIIYRLVKTADIFAQNFRPVLSNAWVLAMKPYLK